MAPTASGGLPHIANVHPDSGSDSDSDAGSSSDSAVAVSLGLPDGPLEADDELNPLVSRIGGRVAWLPVAHPPPEEVAMCAHCVRPMQLLVQIFAPLVDSPYDRTLLVWGCARALCQRKGRGSIRVVRLLQHNARWASKLEKQRQRRLEREQRQAAKDAERERRKREADALKGTPGTNPFAMGGSAAGGTGLFGKADFSKANPFASGPPPTADKAAEDDGSSESEEGEDSDAGDDDEADRLAEELAVKASLQAKREESSESDTWSSDWSIRSPFYAPAQYLNTIAEPRKHSGAGSKRKSDNPSRTAGVCDTDVDKASGGAGERYESTRIPGVDATFEKFAQRVGLEGRQIVRYEWDGTPLPYAATGPTYERLWPRNGVKHAAGAKVTLSNGRSATLLGAGAGADNGSSSKAERTFDAKSIPPCEACGSARTFELQMMPNLVNLLRPSQIRVIGEDGKEDVDREAEEEEGTAGVNEAEKKRREIEKALGRSLPPLPGADGITRSVVPADEQSKTTTGPAPRTGLAWATAYVFVCAKDCCVPREKEVKEGESWREEWIEVQWEDE